MLWIEHADLECVANEITASDHVVSDSTEQNTLFKTVMGKQLHTYTSRCHHWKKPWQMQIRVSFSIAYRRADDVQC